MDFLCGRKQFVKIADSVSSVSHVTAGTPQGTVSGPNDFKLTINDLQFDIGYIKFVYDTTAFSVSNDPNNCLLQKASDYLVSWTNVNGMVINTSKTQEMVVYFGKQLYVDDIPLITRSHGSVTSVVRAMRQVNGRRQNYPSHHTHTP